MKKDSNRFVIIVFTGYRVGARYQKEKPKTEPSQTSKFGPEQTFSGKLQLHCKFRYSHKMLSVIGCLSVTRVYCDKTAEARIMQLSLKCSQMP